jgi:hypothetical protein
MNRIICDLGGEGLDLELSPVMTTMRWMNGWKRSGLDSDVL